jgi:hypothetical protein
MELLAVYNFTQNERKKTGVPNQTSRWLPTLETSFLFPHTEDKKMM